MLIIVFLYNLGRSDIASPDHKSLLAHIVDSSHLFISNQKYVASVV
jgi:hypothetical protein